MKSVAPGQSTFPAEVTNVSRHGFWLFVGERELFVPFQEFPWFREASVRELTNVQLPSPHHLYWPDLDVDLAVESIEHPEKYPLVSQVQPNKRLQPAKARRKPAPKRKARKRLRG
ncbi:MAG: DUF2442 domain-containing protein [Acidobacteria bacterium]|nr:DUF2442 domain-containing protein [Acidobacteriota bacterium]